VKSEGVSVVNINARKVLSWANKMIYVEKVIHLVSRVFDIIARYALLVMVAIVVTNVILRRTWMPIAATYEVVGLMMVIVTGFSLAYCAVAKGHIFIGFILDRFSPRVQAIVDSITGILAVALFGIITWQSCVYARIIWQTNQVIPILRLGYYPVIYALAAAFLLLDLELIVDLIKSLIRVVKG
jgi:TRAP-type C4-dicarboxylate transport system permease small subunit